MSKTVPSQVVEIIDQCYPKDSIPQSIIPMNGQHGAKLGAIISLVDDIPSELITLDGLHFFDLRCSCEAIRTAIEKEKNQDRRDFASGGSILLLPINGMSPVILLRNCLEKCPDEFPSHTTSELRFIEPDGDYRESLRRDFSSMNQALGNGEWKAATIMAGSLLEALLLWCIDKQEEAATRVATTALKGEQGIPNNLSDDPKKWHLPDYIKVAARMKLINDNTKKQAELAQHFRNLIHPGRAIRLQQVCNRATALSAVSAVEHVVNDLTTAK